MVLAHDLSSVQRTQDVKIDQDIVFNALLLSEKTLQGLNNAGFYRPSPIQLHGIPMGKCGFDLLLEAKSGTGKTIVFTVIALEKIRIDKGLQAVILAPTREIASQICDVIKAVGIKYKGLCIEVVMGGLSVQEDIDKFKKGRNVHIVVGSPGRLRHLIQDNYIDTSSVRLLVLDEADKLIEKTFQPDINFIFSSLPTHKQVVMCSATFSESSREFISQYVNEPQHICPDSTSVLLGIEQKVTLVKANMNIVRQTQYRYEELLKILTKKDFKQCLIFCNYQARVSDLYKLLTRDKWPAEKLYGLQQQTDRLDALKTLQEFKCRILISTDLAARGIDASNVDLVINFEPPNEWQTYLHRIGRAGRYGSYGTAVSIIAQGKEELQFKKVLGIMQESLNISYMWENKKYSIAKPECDSLLGLKSDEITNGKEHIDKKPPLEVYSYKNTSKNTKNYETSNNLPNNKDIVQYLWQEKKLNNNAIQTFEDLNLSFEKSSTVDTFDDLMQSLEQYNVSEASTHTMPILFVDDGDVKKCIEILNKELNSPSKIINGNCTEIIKSSEIVNHKTTPSEPNDQKKTKKIDVKTTQHHPSFDNLITKSKVFINGNEINKESNSDSDDEYSEMLRLGLPTAFGSKPNNNYIKAKQKPKVQLSANYPYFQKKNNSVKNVLPSSTQGDCQENNKTKVFESARSLNKKEDLPVNNKTSTNIYKSNKINYCNNYDQINLVNDKQYQNRSKPLKISKPPSKCVSSNEDRTSQNEYLQWYNALKLQTSQMEFMFYMNEMSQM